tara:strand:+ start:387 stop:731 length:345 start_codon:yes stop_codon:yes gene_type:complete
MIKYLLLSLVAMSRSFVMPSFPHFSNVQEFVHTVPYDVRVKIVEDATGILPKLDWFGHMVLNNNEKMIDAVISTNLSQEQKKIVILKIIELCRKGDDMGGKILLDYYNLIDLLL